MWTKCFLSLPPVLRMGGCRTFKAEGSSVGFDMINRLSKGRHGRFCWGTFHQIFQGDMQCLCCVGESFIVEWLKKQHPAAAAKTSLTNIIRLWIHRKPSSGCKKRLWGESVKHLRCYPQITCGLKWKRYIFEEQTYLISDNHLPAVITRLLSVSEQFCWCKRCVCLWVVCDCVSPSVVFVPNICVFFPLVSFFQFFPVYVLLPVVYA